MIDTEGPTQGLVEDTDEEVDMEDKENDEDDEWEDEEMEESEDIEPEVTSRPMVVFFTFMLTPRVI